LDLLTRNISYFTYCGEVNTKTVLQLARDRAQECDIKVVVVASETGRSALKALEVFQEMDVRILVVTHYPATTWGPKGEIPIGLNQEVYATTRKMLIDSGVRIIQSTRPFAPPSRSINWDALTPEGMVDKTLELLGAGTKIAIEVSIIATDAGDLKEGEEIISCAGTFKGLDTALVVRATYSMNFFKDFEIHEIIARPRFRVRKLPEYEFENWKGNLDQYYG
jgi:hypothetical protein